MTWDFAEANVFADAAGDYQRCVGSLSEVLERFESAQPGDVRQMDASSLSGGSKFVFCTDPPYYDNIGYADLSDFFYVWLRRALRNIYPQLFSTVLVPKAQELVATPYRFDGDLKKAKEFFENGFRRTFERIRESQHPEYPLTVFYAFKQAEGEDDEDSSVVSTGWETMLEGLIASQFQVTGTWPMRSEMTTRNIGRGANALASSIVLVCRPRSLDSTVVTEMDFQLALRAELPRAVRTMQQESIAPVDLAQAAIGPGMGIYSRYARVLGPDGKPVPVRKALEMINRVLDEALSEQESEFDSDTRFALAWFQQFGSRSGTFGTADVLSRAMNIAVSGMESAGILEAKAGTVRLLKWEELPDDWDPEKDHRLTVWEMTHHLIRLMYKESDAAAARVLAKLGDEGEKARDLAYRLYQICERSKRSQEAQPYNALVVAWPNLTAEARRLEKRSTPEQMTL
jgi:putative DNA methylase